MMAAETAPGPNTAFSGLAPDVRAVELTRYLGTLLDSSALPVADRDERRHNREMAAQFITDCELEASNAINLDPSEKNINEQLEVLGKVQYVYQLARNPDKAKLETARHQRLTVFRVIGHRFGMDMIPLTLDLARASANLDQLIEQGELGGFMAPDATLEGQRGRVHHGDEARLGATLYLLLHPIAQKTIAELPAPLLNAAVETTQALKDASKARLKQLQKSVELGSDPFLVDDDDNGRSHEMRFLEYQAYHLPVDPEEMLVEVNLPNQIEHIISALGDLYREYDATGVPEGQQLESSLSALYSFRMLSYLRNEIGGTIEFKDRYVWKSDVGAERTVSKRQPLFAVHKIHDTWWHVRPVKAPFTASLDKNRGRCPGKDVVTPNSEGRRLSKKLTEYIMGATGPYKFPEAVSKSGGFAEPDIISTVGFLVVCRLKQAGILQFTNAEFQHHLGPEQHSNGALYSKRAA